MIIVTSAMRTQYCEWECRNRWQGWKKPKIDYNFGAGVRNIRTSKAHF